MKITSRNGKIARLPKEIRHELNRRLEDGATARSLLPWLNELPAVKTVLETHFGGHPLIEQNLSRWKHGGYRDWLLQQDALESAGSLAEDTEELAEAAGRRPRSEQMAIWIESRYAMNMREMSRTKGAERWQLLRQMCTDVVRLRRADQHAERIEVQRERMKLQRERLALERARFRLEYGPQLETERRWQDWSEEEKVAWARRPENHARIEEEEDACSAADRLERMGRVLRGEIAVDMLDEKQLRAWVERPREERDWTEEERIGWALLPENRRRIDPGRFSPEAKAQRIREILGA